MTWRTPREPEPFEIELVPLVSSSPASGIRTPRPPPAGAGTLPGAGELVQRVLDKARAAPAPRLGPDQHQIHPWPELRIHRLVRLPLGDTERALEAVTVAGDRAAPPTAACAHRPPSVPVVSQLARLHLGSARHLGAELDGMRVDGALRVNRHARPTLVEVTVEPWSESASDLSLQVRARRRPAHLPRGYFDVAHRVMDDLWHQIEAAGAR